MYKSLCQSIIDNVGGAHNIRNVGHCTTRLRLSLYDRLKVKEEAIRRLYGVLDIYPDPNTFQVIIGTHVDLVYKDFMTLYTPNESVAVTEETDIPSLISLYVLAPTDGKVVPLANGVGVGIKPDDGHLTAPVDGVITDIQHDAVSVRTGQDTEILLWLVGGALTPLVRLGDAVTVGQPVAAADCDQLAGAIVAVTVVNHQDFLGVLPTTEPTVKRGTVLLRIVQ